jgi:hypothetical protein
MRRLAPALAAGLLVIAALAMVLGLLPRQWTEPKARPPQTIVVEALVTRTGSRATAAPRGARIENDGSLTIPSAPGSPGRALPWSSPPSQWGVQPQRFDPLPPAMASGIRALFREVPQPAAERDQPMMMTLERTVASGLLLLVRGCFRMNSADGPLAVFPPGTRLGLVDGYLMVGPPGFPPELSARVGEHVFWEGKAMTRFDEASRRRIAAACGAGPAQTVLPASATVQQARNDGLAASNFTRRYGSSWTDALRRVRQCRERLEQSLPPAPDRGPLTDNPCGSTPPSPVSDPANCPAGTKLSGGICRTPEGHVRPLPPEG